VRLLFPSTTKLVKYDTDALTGQYYLVSSARSIVNVVSVQLERLVSVLRGG